MSDCEKLDAILKKLDLINTRVAFLEGHARAVTPQKAPTTYEADSSKKHENRRRSSGSDKTASSTSAPGSRSKLPPERKHTVAQEDMYEAPRSGKFFDDNQRNFLSVQLEEVQQFVQRVKIRGGADNADTSHQLENLKSVISALKGDAKRKTLTTSDA